MGFPQRPANCQLDFQMTGCTFCFTHFEFRLLIYPSNLPKISNHLFKLTFAYLIEENLKTRKNELLISLKMTHIVGLTSVDPDMRRPCYLLVHNKGNQLARESMPADSWMWPVGSSAAAGPCYPISILRLCHSSFNRHLIRGKTRPSESSCWSWVSRIIIA